MTFYKSKAWLRKRQRILKRDDYLCRECRRFGRVTGATTVHHVLPRESHPELRLDTDNLVSLCATCHNTMHDRATGALTEVGWEWVGRMRKEAAADIPPTQNTKK